MRKRRRTKRPIVFVCSALVDGKIISETIEADEKKSAEEKFEAMFQSAPSNVCGPFYRKKLFSNIKATDIVLSGETKTAEYGGWLVRATILKSPENCAFLLFEKRLDEKKSSKPQGMKIVSIDNLKFRDE